MLRHQQLRRIWPLAQDAEGNSALGAEGNDIARRIFWCPPLVQIYRCGVRRHVADPGIWVSADTARGRALLLLFDLEYVG